MSPISLLVTLVALVYVAAEPPLRESLVSQLSPAQRDPPAPAEPDSGLASASPEESEEHDVQQNPPLVRAHKEYRYPLLKHPRPNAALAHYRPKVIEHEHLFPKRTTRYDYCGIAVSGTQNHADLAQVDVKPTIIPPKKDVELVFGNYCGKQQQLGGHKVLGMQVIACDLGGKEKPYVIEQLHNEDSVKFNHFDVYGTPEGVIVFAKQFCGNRLG